VVSNIFYFHPYLGKISNLPNIFQMGWNHQLVMFPTWRNMNVTASTARDHHCRIHGSYQSMPADLWYPLKELKNPDACFVGVGCFFYRTGIYYHLFMFFLIFVGCYGFWIRDPVWVSNFYVGSSVFALWFFGETHHTLRTQLVFKSYIWLDTRSWLKKNTIKQTICTLGSLRDTKWGTYQL